MCSYRADKFPVTPESVLVAVPHSAVEQLDGAMGNPVPLSSCRNLGRAKWGVLDPDRAVRALNKNKLALADVCGNFEGDVCRIA